ncbi:phage minor head protein [Limnobaculum xujianqingii]|uniref:phage minor head protein n=1 Tax=Limnobaculum xujianqingii TaxID=2738837 RepID=UPI0011284F80|nr:phage minor head protein [Limnobaculum xujianqingii]
MRTVNDRMLDESIAHSLFVSRYSNGVALRMVNTLNQADAELSASLLASLDVMEPDSFSVRRLDSLLSSVRDINRQIYQRLYGSLTNELSEFIGYDSGFQLSLFDSLLPDLVKERFPLTGITPQQVYASAMARPFQGRLLSEWTDKLEADRMQRITNAVSQGYLQGETTEQIYRRVRGTKARNYQDGVLQTGRANATSVIKTAVNHMAAVARTEFGKANTDVIDCKQWRSTLDNRTTPTCIIRDCLRYTLDNKPIGHKIPYGTGPGRIHYCCRSTETFVVKSWRELGIDVDEMPEGTRASMDGQVPAGTNFRDWLQRQPYKRQVEVLGETRARLMRDGGIHPSEFFTDKGEWLTLEQLRKIDEQAFIDAGL